MTHSLKTMALAARGMASKFALNYLWPILGGLATAVLTALTADAPARVADGVDRADAYALAGSVLSACLGYFLVLLQRHGGSREPWTQPPK